MHPNINHSPNHRRFTSAVDYRRTTPQKILSRGIRQIKRKNAPRNARKELRARAREPRRKGERAREDRQSIPIKTSRNRDDKSLVGSLNIQRAMWPFRIISLDFRVIGDIAMRSRLLYSERVGLLARELLLLWHTCELCARARAQADIIGDKCCASQPAVDVK